MGAHGDIGAHPLQGYDAAQVPLGGLSWECKGDAQLCHLHLTRVGATHVVQLGGSGHRVQRSSSSTISSRLIN